jgi:hypothetical protein
MLTPFVSILFSSTLLNRSHAVVAGSLMTQLLPLLMMRHRRVPRAKWVDHITPTGKHWIEHVRVSSFSLSILMIETTLGA